MWREREREKERERYTVLYETKPVYHYSLLDPDKKSKENGQISSAWVKRCARRGEPSRYFRIFHIFYSLRSCILTMSRKWRDYESTDWRIISKKKWIILILLQRIVLYIWNNEIIEIYILNFLIITLNIWMNITKLSNIE